ncbi:TM2 domain protein [Halorhabdus tiamatea SARL4B]|uniref:TM2 domain protein n=1 Tax=Halorhabdus tiamatea SARL4B TaxID=1033806 RepID=F7PIZ2_9EURY|nr:zinc ribbon domain-containing protein [Halorhabdus tiamatea]ERJ05906.1 TM2 domain protein [Halorhabdus tiamatea SARL4B]CCQ32958.1 conserved hypothetical protein [Halorhabdus tiamatea SARL4B]
MRQSIDRKRPWLAAVLSAFVTGLGHLYLRRFRRAVGWLAVAIGVGLFFVDPAVAESLAAGTLSNPLAAWPVFVVSLLSVLDAYVLARAENILDAQAAEPDEPLTRCPSCGKELDETLSFCPWCSAELDRPTPADQPAKEP